jgi:hypothetical protein
VRQPPGAGSSAGRDGRTGGSMQDPTGFDARSYKQGEWHNFSIFSTSVVVCSIWEGLIVVVFHLCLAK